MRELKDLLVAITGASGTIYADRLLRKAAGVVPRMDLVLSIHYLYDRTQDASLLRLAAKVHEQGFNALTGPEKRLLQRVSTEYRQRTKRPS